MLLLEKLELNEFEIAEAADALNKMKPWDLSWWRYFIEDVKLTLDDNNDVDWWEEILTSVDIKDQQRS